jgi:hypothetical protein
MPYDKSNVDDAKKKGIFDNNTLDPKVLTLSIEEKAKMQKDLSKAQKNMNMAGESAAGEDQKREERRQKPAFDISLTLFERLLAFFLQIFGIESVDKFKMNKIIKLIGRELSKIKPPIYNYSNRRVTRFYAYKIYDLYLRLIGFRQLFERTLGDPKIWDNPNIKRAAVEVFFEKMAGINSDEVNARFGEDGLARTLAEFDNAKSATDTVNKAVYAYLFSIDKELIDQINRSYTNLVYFQRLAEYDFLQLFRRFDSDFTPASSPSFMDIPGEALLSYLKDLEENILQIDLSMDSVAVFQKLQQTALLVNGDALVANDTDVRIDMSVLNDEGKLTNTVILLIEALKELMMKKFNTLLIQVIKNDPTYGPSIVHTRYDLYKIYCEVLEKRVTLQVKKIMKERRNKKIEDILKMNFPDFQWVGVCTASLSEKLEMNGFTPFLYFYHLALVSSFLRHFYEELIKSVLNIVLLNGNFMETHFKKTCSDNFYGLEAYHEEYKTFMEELGVEGVLGKKLMALLARKDENQADYRKVVERNILSINGRSGEMFDKFFALFQVLLEIVNKIFTDVDAKPPKNIRNIRGIGGLKNSRLMNAIEKSFHAMNQIKELIRLLREQ